MLTAVIYLWHYKDQFIVSFHTIHTLFKIRSLYCQIVVKQSILKEISGNLVMKILDFDAGCRCLPQGEAC